MRENFITALEALRSRFVREIDPFFAIHNSQIDPLPHQIDAVYNHMLRQNPTRFMLADAPGAGKTIMAGLFITEKLARGEISNCLIVTPGSLVEQWRFELESKFNLEFKIWNGDRIGANDLTIDLTVASIDKLVRTDLPDSKIDLAIFDEAHKISATLYGKKLDQTKRFKLGRKISRESENLLLLTATPHSGDETRFRLLLSLLDEDRFYQTPENPSTESLDLRDIMLLRTKEDLIDRNGSRLFPPRHSTTISYSLSQRELELYDRVTDYVREEFNRAEKLKSDRKNSIGFAMTILQRRLASSPEAIYQSLRRRSEKLGTKSVAEDPDDIEENYSTASETKSEIAKEIETLENLTALADRVRESDEDRKFLELEKFLATHSEKLIIFTEHRDTLDYLDSKIYQRRLKIHGGMTSVERRGIEQKFQTDPEIMILLATDAAGEGINLQAANLVINYDLPWNPNRLEQRFGRVHRIGQKLPCTLINLVANQTREGQVFHRLLQKLDQERKTLGDKIFDVLGKVRFENLSLDEVLRSFDKIPREISFQIEESKSQPIPIVKIPPAQEKILPRIVWEKIPLEILKHEVEFESDEVTQSTRIEIVRENIVDGIGKIFGESLRFKPTPPRDLPFNTREIESESLKSIRSWRTDLLDIEYGGFYDRLYAMNLLYRLRARYERNNLQRQFRIESESLGSFTILPKQKLPPDSLSRKEVEELAMEIVCRIERENNRLPIDVSSENLGYDIRSIDSVGREFYIEVKGREPDSREVTVSRNEIETAQRLPNYFLAIVQISKRAVYLEDPFSILVDESVLNVSFDIKKLIERSAIFYEESLII